MLNYLFDLYCRYSSNRLDRQLGEQTWFMPPILIYCRCSSDELNRQMVNSSMPCLSWHSWFLPSIPSALCAFSSAEIVRRMYRPVDNFFISVQSVWCRPCYVAHVYDRLTMTDEL